MSFLLNLSYDGSWCPMKSFLYSHFSAKKIEISRVLVSFKNGSQKYSVKHILCFHRKKAQKVISDIHGVPLKLVWRNSTPKFWHRFTPKGLRGYILGVLTHKTAWDWHWGGNETLKWVLIYAACSCNYFSERGKVTLWHCLVVAGQSFSISNRYE